MKLVRETLRETQNFERGGEIYKRIGIGQVRPYPQMTPEQFKRWFDEEISPRLDPKDGLEALGDNLIANTWEKDDEVEEYLRIRGIDIELIPILLELRDYFNDKRYIEKLNLPW